MEVNKGEVLPVFPQIHMKKEQRGKKIKGGDE